MRQQVSSRTLRIGFGVMASGLMLAACQSSPGAPRYFAAAPGAPVEPVSVALDPAVVADIGGRENEWGGIVPDALPTVPVDDGGLGEVE